jgi:hypothetical protein
VTDGVEPEVAKIVQHVHLIMVSDVVGNVRPTHMGQFVPSLQRCFEPRDPRVQLGRDADLREEPALELAQAEPRPSGEIRYPHASASQLQVLRDRGDIRACDPVRTTPQQVVIDSACALRERRTLAQPTRELIDGAPQHRAAVEMAVR